MIYKKTLTTNNKTAGSNTCEYIIVHHTATGYNTINGVIKTLTTGDVSCHYVVDTNGDVYKIGNDKDILWHAGESSRDGKVGMNNYSIGIEVIGPLPGFTDEQRKSVKKLIKELMKAHNIPNNRILRHADIAPGRKVDIDLSFVAPLSRPQYQQSFISSTDISMTQDELKLFIEGEIKTNSFFHKILEKQKSITPDKKQALIDAQKGLEMTNEALRKL